MSKIKIGFDPGNRSLKIAVSRQGRVEQHELVLPEHLVENDVITMPNAFSAFLKKAKKELKLPSGPAGLILPASQVICRKVTMPYMSVDQLLLNLPHEFSDFIHEEAHQYHCDYAICQDQLEQGEEAEGELTMMAAAAEKQQIQKYIEIFSAGGFSLKMILPQEMALIQLVDACCRGSRQAPEEYCLIDLGQLSTRVFVCRRDRTQAVRRINVGCQALDEVAADVLNMDAFLAATNFRANHNGMQEHPRCMEIYEQIAVEVLKIINFYHFTYRQNQLDGVYLIGGGAHIQPLRRMLEESLDLPALSLEQLTAPIWGQGALDPTGVCAAGLLLGQREGERA